MINFPTSFDSDSTFYLAVNNKRTALTASINSSTLTIPVTSTTGFPSSGFITILTGTDVTLAECIAYTSVGPTQFNATLRGADGTTALAHTSGDYVDLTVVAAHHNVLKDAVVALEHFVGVSGSENLVPLRLGSAVIPQNTVTNRVSANIVAVSGSLTVSGIAVPITSVPIVGLRGITVISGSNNLSISGTLPYKSSSTYTTTSIGSSGGVGSFNIVFNNRSLVRKLVVTPGNVLANSTIVEFFTSSSFSSPSLEYQATTSGTFTDNFFWFHEDTDGTGKYHLRITNNSAVSSAFTIDTIEEVFEP